MTRFDIRVTKLWEKIKNTLFYEIKNVNIQVFESLHTFFYEYL